MPAIERDWPGETVFILASGPSVSKLDLSLLSGRRVIAVKSSWVVYPAADILFFADARWWKEKSLKPTGFHGQIISTDISDPPVIRVSKVSPKELSTDRGKVALARTSTTGAINVALHKGAKKIVLLGVDGKLAPDGTRHCHRLKWPWAKGALPESFAAQAAEYRAIAPSAKALGLEIVNANPDSAVDAFPKVRFEDCFT